MHFLLLSSTYYPEKKSASFMLKELSKSFLSKGHKITVITFSNEIKDSVSLESINGVSVIRLKVSNPKFSKVRRALIELSYSRKIITYIKQHDIGDIDGVIFFSPSIFFGRAVSLIKKFYSVKSYLIVRDIFPDWLVKIKQLKKGPIYYFFKIFEYINFNSANFIGTESVADIKHVKNLIGKKPINIEQLRNWFSEAEAHPESSEREELLSNSKLNLLYGGSLGLAQNIIDFLRILEKQDIAKSFNIIIVGSGEQKIALEEFSRNSTLDITITQMMERNDYFNLVKKSDAGLVILDRNLEANNYPGKSFDYMSFKKPLICFLHEDNEFGHLVEKEDFGYFIKANDTDSFLKNLDSFSHDAKNRNKKGENSYKYLKKYFTVDRASKQIIERFLTEK